MTDVTEPNNLIKWLGETWYHFSMAMNSKEVKRETKKIVLEKASASAILAGLKIGLAEERRARAAVLSANGKVVHGPSFRKGRRTARKSRTTAKLRRVLMRG